MIRTEDLTSVGTVHQSYEISVFVTHFSTVQTSPAHAVDNCYAPDRLPSRSL